MAGLFLVATVSIYFRRFEEVRSLLVLDSKLLEHLVWNRLYLNELTDVPSERVRHIV